MHIHELMAKLAMVEGEFRTKHGCAPSQPQLASLVGITAEKLEMLRKVCAAVTHSSASTQPQPSIDGCGCFRSRCAFMRRLQPLSIAAAVFRANSLTMRHGWSTAVWQDSAMNCMLLTGPLLSSVRQLLRVLSWSAPPPYGGVHPCICAVVSSMP